MVIGGLLFRLGVFVAVVAIAAHFTKLAVPFQVLAWVAGVISIVGIFVTATASSRPFLEVADDET